MSDTLGSQTGGLGADGLEAFARREHEELVSSKRVTSIPNNQQTLLAYDADNNLQYVGFAPKGLATSSSGWLLYKLSYTSGNMTSKQIAYDSWDNRASASYS